MEAYSGRSVRAGDWTPSSIAALHAWVARRRRRRLPVAVDSSPYPLQVSPLNVSGAGRVGSTRVSVVIVV